jgi:hypothetical protein
MSKSLTLSMSLALALGFTGVSLAGHDSGCSTCGIASPQGSVVSPQSSPQGGYETCGTCAPAKKHFSFKLSMPECLKPKPKMYTYEWVLKKKRVHGHAASTGCDTCGTAVTPSGQYSSPQATYAAPQASYAAPQAYGASQTMSPLPTSEVKPPMTGDSVPAAPSTPAAPAPAPPAPPATTGTQSSLLFLSPAGN